MCEVKRIRFVHVMKHQDYPDELRCGCVCAGNMEQNLQAARRREASMKNTTKRRAAFPTLKNWRVSQNGNPWIRRDGWSVTIFRRGNGFKVILSRQGEKLFLPPIFPTADEAKLAAFDAMYSRKVA